MEIEAGYGAYSQFITQSDVKEIGLVGAFHQYMGHVYLQC